MKMSSHTHNIRYNTYLCLILIAINVHEFNLIKFLIKDALSSGKILQEMMWHSNGILHLQTNVKNYANKSQDVTFSCSSVGCGGFSMDAG